MKRSLGVSELVPNGVVTVTATEPVPGGAFTLRTVDFLLIFRMAAGVPPKSTAVSPPNPEPVILTLVPPAARPLVGEMLVTTGLTEPDQGPVSLTLGTDQVPDTAPPPGRLPLNVSLELDATTLHAPAHEIVPVTAEPTDSMAGVSVIVMEPATLNGAFRPEKTKLPDQGPYSKE